MFFHKGFYIYHNGSTWIMTESNGDFVGAYKSARGAKIAASIRAKAH